VTIPARLVLISSSFLPLFILLALRASVDDMRIAVVFIFLSLALLGLLLWYILTLDRSIPAAFNLHSAEQGSQQVAAYVVAYLVPFASASFMHWQDVAAQIVIIILLIGIFYQADFFYFNPVLSLCGYRLWDCTVNSAGADDERWKMLLLVRRGQLTSPPGEITVRKITRQIGVYSGPSR
jgi:hypothetical protein